MPFPERIEIRGSDRFYVSDNGDEQVLTEVYEENAYHVQTTVGMKMLDIGANKGIFSVWAAKRGAKVTAYEPNPKTYKTLLRNIKLNHASIQSYCAGVWHERTNKLFYPNAWNSGGSSLYPEHGNEWNEEPINVLLYSFDDILGDKEWDFVKLDCEGAEVEILTNSKKLNQVKRFGAEIHCVPTEDFYNKRELMCKKVEESFVTQYNLDMSKLDRRTLKSGFMMWGYRK